MSNTNNTKPKVNENQPLIHPTLDLTQNTPQMEIPPRSFEDNSNQPFQIQPPLQQNMLPQAMPISNPNLTITNPDASAITNSMLKDKDKTYLVRLPHSRFEFNVRGLLVEEEDIIKSSNDGAKSIITKLMKILYDCISDDIKTKDHPFGRFETFLSNLSLEDRDTLIFAVISQTYENNHEMYIRCNRCGEGFTEEISMNDCLNFEYYNEQDPILHRREIIEFPEHDWRVYIKIPTVADEMKTINSNPSVKDMQRASDYLFIDKIDYVHHSPDNKVNKKDSTNNYVEVYGLIRKKPALIRKVIEKAYRKLNTNPITEKEYGVTARHMTSCKNCGSSITVNIVPISHLLFLVQ